MDTKYTFWKLISEYQIEIPIIQRDYAQGRKDKVKIANQFLDDIKNAIIQDKPLNMDFVYGRVDTAKNGEKTFIPLDGQQRLTTLFLLHWYLALKENRLCEESIQATLAKFTYQTRPSSKDFCEKLVKKAIQYPPNNQFVSETIKDRNWFFLSWMRDPTVKAMLNMLDLIQAKFNNLSDSEFQRLFDQVHSPITFQFLPLDAFKLTDELYIKMNARGKPLTEFENFKAGFSKYLEATDKKKLDNEWLDIFWNRAKKDKETQPEKVDDDFFNFFTNITLNLYVEKNEEWSNYNLFEAHKDVYDKDDRVNIHKVVKTLDSLIAFNDDKNIFLNFLKLNPTYWERVRFYALTQFFYEIGEVAGNDDIFNRWMRVTKNLINNTLIQSPEEYVRAIQSIKKLSTNIQNIYHFIEQSPDNIDYFLGIQREEESLKAKLILKDKTWERLFNKIEHHSYFDGQIGFILEYTKDGSGNYAQEVFEDYSEKINALFSDNFKEKHKFLFQRALLVKGDYLVEARQNKTFCVFEDALRTKIDNWRKVFNDKQKTLLLKELLDEIDKNDIKGGLNKIIEKSPVSDWRKYLIENSDYISYCHKRQIRQYGEKIYLLSKTQMNGKHAELYSYNLHEKFIKSDKYPPFKIIEYYFSNSWIHPCIILYSWQYQKNKFTINVGYTQSFYMKFFDENKKEIPKVVHEKLTELGFKFINNTYDFNFKSDGINFDDVCSGLKIVCKKLNELY